MRLPFSGNPSLFVTLQILLIIACIFAVYLPIFQSGFVGDDYAFIVNWKSIRSFSDIPLLLRGETPPGHEGVFRPLRSINYVISYHFYKASPLGYHIQSLVIHILVSLMVYAILLQITKSSLQAFTASLIFGIHPIHIEAITFITAGFEMAGILWLMISIYLYIRATQKKQQLYIYALSVLFCFLAFFTYEMTLILPFILILYDLIIIQKTKKIFLAKSYLYLPYSIIAAGYLFIRFMLFHIGMKHPLHIDIQRLTQFPVVLLRYLINFIFPQIYSGLQTVKGTLTLSTFHTDKAVNSPLQQNYTPELLFIIIFSFFYLVILLKKKNRPMIFFSLWYIVALIPVLIISLQDLPLSEKYAYLASIGLSFIFSIAFNKLICTKVKAFWQMYIKILLLLFLSFMLILYGIVAFRNNYLWGYDWQINRLKIMREPDGAFKYNDLGVLYATEGNIPSAVASFKHSLQIDPDYSTAKNNLQKIYDYQKKRIK